MAAKKKTKKTDEPKKKSKLFFTTIGPEETTNPPCEHCGMPGLTGQQDFVPMADGKKIWQCVNQQCLQPKPHYWRA
jgi:hypothetical protein